MIRIGGIEHKYPESFSDTCDIIDKFCKWYSQSYYGALAGSTFAHIVLDDLNLEDHFIFWCLEWEHMQPWIDDQMGLIDDSRGTEYTQAMLKKQVLQQAAAIIRFLADLTIIPEELRVEYVDD